MDGRGKFWSGVNQVKVLTHTGWKGGGRELHSRTNRHTPTRQTLHQTTQDIDVMSNSRWQRFWLCEESITPGLQVYMVFLPRECQMGSVGGGPTLILAWVTRDRHPQGNGINDYVDCVLS